MLFFYLTNCYIVFLIFLCCPLVACALIVLLTLVLSMIFAKLLEVMFHFHTDLIFTLGDLVNSVSAIVVVEVSDFLEFFSVVTVSYREFALL